MPSSQKPPHVFLVSFPLQGHVNPLLRLGARLAARGLLVTFTTFRHAGLRAPRDDGGACIVAERLRFEYLRRSPEDDDPGRYQDPSDMLRHVADEGPAALAGLIRRQVGVRLPAPATRDALRACVDEVMSGPQAAAFRMRAMAWKEEATASVADGGSSDRNLQAFVEDIRRCHEKRSEGKTFCL
ncbi:cinnamate beta-D-glucosyltransferase-like [Panicum miliaceum]|uniref:Cinnamate beta-D-glucosyltransferase-like n=1 Tax=Panicum miliaceum TaxID=4540 RepID=A0A3L6RDV0_PANMI|nr:cinnamate beta-D-glucosyltransferase-like [Panicum miliaceum]